jgi:hypothetical protein
LTLLRSSHRSKATHAIVKYKFASHASLKLLHSRINAFHKKWLQVHNYSAQLVTISLFQEMKDVDYPIFSCSLARSLVSLVPTGSRERNIHSLPPDGATTFPCLRRKTCTSLKGCTKKTSPILSWITPWRDREESDIMILVCRNDNSKAMESTSGK